MDKTKIDWCDSSWNPVSGCCHTCAYCYARGIAKRFGKPVPDLSRHDGLHVLDNPIEGNPYPYGFEPTLHAYRLDEYAKKMKGRNIFVCSMADLFGDFIPDEWIEEVFDACKKAPQHNYLFLTKNPVRYALLQLEGMLPKADNMWYGVTATDRESLFGVLRSVGHLEKTVHIFISIEPLLGDMVVDGSEILQSYFDWVIIGAESGRRKGKVVPEKAWIDKIVKDAKKDISHAPVFMKSSLDTIMGKGVLKEFPKSLKKSV